MLASEKEHAEAQRHDPGEDAPGERSQSGTHSRGRESDGAGMAWILTAQLSFDLQDRGRLGSYASAEHPPQACAPAGSRSWTRSPALAKFVLCQARVFLPGNSLCRGVSIPFGVRPSTGEPDAGN